MALISRSVNKKHAVNLFNCVLDVYKRQNLYIITYNPFEEKETEFDIYSCSQCGAMYIEAEGKYRKMENLLKYEVKLR